MKRTFVIGDVHGHVDRLLALLTRAGIVNQHDEGYSRRSDVEVVQLGDLGQFDVESRVGDMACYTAARGKQRLIDVVLWGNHDRAVVDPECHRFRGFTPPPGKLVEAVMAADPVFAYEAHGWLLTHAGLGPIHGQGLQGMPASKIAKAINELGGSSCTDDIGHFRGGLAAEGGVLWRDSREGLLLHVPQVFGHSRGDIRCYEREGSDKASWCIDVGSKLDGNLAGIWLPEQKIVAIGPDAGIFETQGIFREAA